jgi:hypothetical protein
MCFITASQRCVHAHFSADGWHSSRVVPLMSRMMVWPKQLSIWLYIVQHMLLRHFDMLHDMLYGVPQASW